MARPDRTFIKLGLSIAALGVLILLLVAIYTGATYGWAFLQSAGWLFYLALIPITFVAMIFVCSLVGKRYEGTIGAIGIILCLVFFQQSCSRLYGVIVEESQLASRGEPPKYVPDLRTGPRDAPIFVQPTIAPTVIATAAPTATPTATPTAPPVIQPMTSFQVLSLKFYETDVKPSLIFWDAGSGFRIRRDYRQLFNTSVQHVCWEMEVAYVDGDAEKEVRVSTVWYGRIGRVLWGENYSAPLTSKTGRLGVTGSWDSTNRGGWRPDDYSVDIKINDQKVMTGTFTIEE
jgi:hypothetical protein